MITFESLQEIANAAKKFDIELEKIISYDWSKSNIINATTMMKYRASHAGSSNELKDEVKNLKQEYINNILPADFKELLPLIRIFNKDKEERTLVGVDLIEALDSNNPQRLSMPTNSQNYTIEYKFAFNNLEIPNPKITVLDNETNKKWEINCGICSVDWLKVLNLQNSVNKQEFDIACSALKNKNGVIKVNCNNGVVTYVVETQTENKTTHQLEKKQISRNNFYELMLTVVEQYHNKIGDFIEFATARANKKN